MTAHQTSILTPKPDFYAGLELPRAECEGPWIRLLRIQPAQYDEPLSATLLRRPLHEDGIGYVALSYSWRQGIPADREDDMPMEVLQLHQQPFSISTHLANGLRRLRAKRLPVYVWVDALCINQSDFVERGSQVPLMAQIYGRAAQVYVWLGEPSAADLANLQLWLCRQERPWWTRLWIVQECIFSTQCPIMLLGAQQMGMGELIEWLDSSNWPTGSLVQRPTGLLADLYQSWQIQQHDGSAQRSLRRWMILTENLKCADFHDKVYALLSLLPEKDASGLPVNYLLRRGEFVVKILPALLKSADWQLGASLDVWRFISQLDDCPEDFVTTYQVFNTFRDGLIALRRNQLLHRQIFEHSELKDACVDDITESIQASSPARRISGLSGAPDLWGFPKSYKWAFTWWIRELSHLDAQQNDFQRLCYLYSDRPWKGSGPPGGFFEFRSSSGVCGMCLSVPQFRYKKILFSPQDRIGLLIGEEHGTCPCYIITPLDKIARETQSTVLLKFDHPSDRGAISSHLSLTETWHQSDDNVAASRKTYTLGFAISREAKESMDT